AARTFSASTSRVPPGSESASATHEIDPFCTPCEPAARINERQRASRYSIDLPSDSPISASEPPPEVKRTFTPREAYADARNAFDQGVSSPSTNTGSVPYTDSVSAYVTRPWIASRRFKRSSTAHCVITPGRLGGVGGEQRGVLLQVRHVRLVRRRPPRAELLEREHELHRVEHPHHAREPSRCQPAREAHELGPSHVDVDQHPRDLIVAER